jgi:hypothetical protein
VGEIKTVIIARDFGLQSRQAKEGKQARQDQFGRSHILKNGELHGG